jgi:predicted RNA-binding Zn ribbon-like protein
MNFVGGSLCLDFVNTVGGWTPNGKVIGYKIHEFDDLARWAQLAGVIPKAEVAVLAGLARKQPTQSQSVTRRAVALRRSLYRVFLSLIRRRKLAETDLKILRQELSVARSRQRLVQATGRFGWQWTDSQTSLDSILWRVSASAADLLTSLELSRLRQCGGPNCGWMFLDVTRNHSRTWCDMKDCGNREKVRRFRERHGPLAKPGRR